MRRTYPFGFDDPGGSGQGTAPPGSDWLPPVDISETEDAFEVVLEVCGVPREDMEVSLEADRLTVSGVRKPAAGDEVCHYRERSVGRFARAFAFRTPVDADGIQAKLADGLLILTIPKRRPVKVALA